MKHDEVKPKKSIQISSGDASLYSGNKMLGNLKDASPECSAT